MISKATTQELDQQLLQGIAKDLQAIPSLFLGGSTYTPGSLSALIQSRIDAANAVDTTKAAWLAAVKTYSALNAEASTVVRDLRNFVLGAFGESSALLSDFGFKAPHPAAKTPEPQAAALPQCMATRKARRALRKNKRKARPTKAASRSRA